MGNLFVPDHFVFEASSPADVKLASIAFGFQLGFSILTASKAGSQTVKIFRRVHRVTTYVALTWVEIIANLILGLLCWVYLIGKIEPSFHYYFILVCCWCLEMQCLIQIIRNRLCLLITSEREKFWLKWGSFLIVLGINISVFCIWIPARLQIAPFWIQLNNIWDRIEKAIFFFLDGGLNVYFVVLVKRKLLSGGMTKYRRLFQFNIAMIAISLSLDIMLIGLMSLPNGLIYAQFHPLIYMIKLNIEMSMAALIGKIARSADGSTPSGPSTDGIKMTLSGVGNSKSKSRTGGARKRRSGEDGKGGGIGGYLSSDGEEVGGMRGMSPGRKRFNPTVSEVMAGDGDGERMYHAWVSTDAGARLGQQGGQHHQQQQQGGRWGRGGQGSREREKGDAGSDEDEGKGQIVKETHVQVVEEGAGGFGIRERVPSEDGSTTRLRP